MDCNQLSVRLLLVLSVMFGVRAGLAKLRCDAPAIDLCQQQVTVTCEAYDGATAITEIHVFYGGPCLNYQTDNKNIMQVRTENVSVSLKDRVVTLTLFGINTDEQKCLKLRIITPEGTPEKNLNIPKATKEIHCNDPVIDTCQQTATIKCRTNKSIRNVTLNWSLNGSNHTIYIDTQNMSAKQQQQNQDISVEIQNTQLMLTFPNIKIYNNTILRVEINTPATTQSCGIPLLSHHYEGDCKPEADTSALTPESQTGQNYIVIFLSLGLVLIAAAAGYWLWRKKISPPREPRERSESQGPLIEDAAQTLEIPSRD
ncbi:uncharacterized protein LOC121398164 [Xenopus laevis]|uniref:Uncharacterized protein LOC121398164 n=2 Tax=Xenopus laevis TaxID=8355 RepID=A0A1L8EUL6_XENLA|nr:uncharacterized protein LOC121398164 [Xenopus laevis]OCT63037.1 hypothetical protein XELAEV_18044131mg [Xenopus laevis]